VRAREADRLLGMLSCVIDSAHEQMDFTQIREQQRMRCHQVHRRSVGDGSLREGKRFGQPPAKP